jgi:hypothetical protein
MTQIELYLNCLGQVLASSEDLGLRMTLVAYTGYGSKHHLAKT